MLFLLAAEFLGRVIYDGNASITLKRLKMSDEGWLVCTVDFENGGTIYYEFILEVGSK